MYEHTGTVPLSGGSVPLRYDRDAGTVLPDEGTVPVRRRAFKKNFYEMMDEYSNGDPGGITGEEMWND